MEKGSFLIRDYVPSDDQAVLDLDRRGPQGKELQISFHRQSFLYRSEMYDEFAVLVGLYEGKLVSVVAGAVKEVLINGKKIRAGSPPHREILRSQNHHPLQVPCQSGV
jgi:hypothetical protein